MKTRILCVLVGLMLVGCVEADRPTKAEVTPQAVEFAGDSKADGSPYAVYQGDLEVDDRHEAWLPKRTKVHYWTFEAASGDDIFLDVASRDGDDMYVLLYRAQNGGWSYVGGNDDCDSNTLNSCLRVTGDDGQYLALVSTYRYLAQNQPTAATYEIEAMCDDGACAAPPVQACGSRGLQPCPDDTYCDWPDANICGRADGPGTCQPLPEVCTLDVSPICGCDGLTYTNRCAAAILGIDTLHPGACARPGQPEGSTCGGIAALQCEDGLKCNYSGNMGCNIADAAGVCVVDEPRFCTAHYDPVCGCDGRTYSNACHLGGAGVGYDHDGPCN